MVGGDDQAADPALENDPGAPVGDLESLHGVEAQDEDGDVVNSNLSLQLSEQSGCCLLTIS